MKMECLTKGLVLTLIIYSISVIQSAIAECSVPGAVVQGSSCLLASRFYTNWADAFRFCGSLGCVLAAPENDLKISEIQEYAHSVGLNFELYLGGTDANSEGTFVRAGTGNILHNMNWAQGEPNGNRQENCMMAENVRNFTVSDTNCDGNMRFICDCTPSSPTALDATEFA